jgi:antitoxin (DNA-binding transcriptional repressor) of toxin-antitoxin stability system
MKSMTISEFKSKCIAVLKDAQRSGKGLVVTWRGQPLARIEPITGTSGKRKLGTFRGSMTIMGDIVNVDTGMDWEMLK